MNVMVLTRDAVCAHEGCLLPGEPHERWGHGFTFCEAHMEYAQQIFNRSRPPKTPKVPIPPGTPKCHRGHAKTAENLTGEGGCRACHNALCWARRHKITGDLRIQQKADARYWQILGATT